MPGFSAMGVTGWCEYKKRPRQSEERVCSREMMLLQDGLTHCGGCIYWNREQLPSRTATKPRLSARKGIAARRFARRLRTPFKPRKIA